MKKKNEQNMEKERTVHRCDQGTMLNKGCLESRGKVRSVLRGVMRGSVLGMLGLNWDTGPIHAKNRLLCS